MTDQNTYHMSFRNMPRDLMARAIEKCRQQDPPVSLRYKIVELVKEWLGDTPKRSRSKV